MQDPKIYHRSDLVIAIIAAFVIIIMAFLFTGCMTGKKAVYWMDNHAFKAAQYCNSRFPVDTVLKPGQTITLQDTIFQSGPSIPCPVRSGYDSLIYVKCPPNRTITIQKIRVDTLPVTNTRQISSLEGQISTLQTNVGNLSNQVTSLKKGRNVWRSIAILALVIIFTGLTVFIGVKFKFI